MGSRRYGSPSQHLARDIVPVGAFETPDSVYLNPDWDEKESTSGFNVLYAVANGTVFRHPDYSYTFILEVDQDNDGVADVWFQYRHAELTVGQVRKFL